jgi:hypothetical protein
VNKKFFGIALGTVAALLALSLVVRLVSWNEYGLAGGWTFFGLPFGGIGILVLLLRVFAFGHRSQGTVWPFPHTIESQPPTAVPPPPTVPTSRRLHELECLRASGAISSAEYLEKRQQIIANL